MTETTNPTVIRARDGRYVAAVEAVPRDRRLTRAPAVQLTSRRDLALRFADRAAADGYLRRHVLSNAAFDVEPA
jgi:hypothetical protein